MADSPQSVFDTQAHLKDCKDPYVYIEEFGEYYIYGPRFAEPYRLSRGGGMEYYHNLHWGYTHTPLAFRSETAAADFVAAMNMGHAARVAKHFSKEQS